ncbi:MAG TPA: 30S ribosomal protein S9 [Candidatus Ornithospirochaeta avicola]|uniref:Small ribosomal subunit protein uS9 n=1 Tax=Candidatus Ornithospirochaeta avicola TaxID=2840896 RepID=A0A9D1TMZ0_9SPIO|nr:30S ribosomal protein S9 [Candidatus Ornithospirochaeta avicola]
MAKKAAVKENKVVNLSNAVGRRKTAVARVYLRSGNGKIVVNGRELDKYFVDALNVTTVTQPLTLLEVADKYDVVINVYGGGIKGQAEACRHGVARALVAEDASYKDALHKAGLMTRDPRMVERKKYGQKKARKRFQFSKR